MVWSDPLPAIHSGPEAPTRPRDRGAPRPAFAWVPAALLGAGLALGLVLWSQWGFAIAFEAIRVYCF